MNLKILQPLKNVFSLSFIFNGIPIENGGTSLYRTPEQMHYTRNDKLYKPGV